jgi:2-polyprenyl-6-methoxyphenol hydroxylase-like FAD-dependent oxidoreductase
MQTDIIIIGAGSTGLFLANVLEQKGFSSVIIEQRKEPVKHSKAIGIHPPGLKLLDSIGVLDAFLSEGLSVLRGLAYVGKEKVGELTLGKGSTKSDRVLTLPQYQTEKNLEDSLKKTVLLRGSSLKSITQLKNHVSVTYTADEREQQLHGKYLIGCDGSNSLTRSLLGIRWQGQTYPYRYAMGDFDDQTAFGTNALIWLSKHGLTESFPLPGGKRRWVVNHELETMDLSTFLRSVKSRTECIPDVSTNSMFSAFNIHQFTAHTTRIGRCFLCGDSMGVMSPIGGQAMSLHWYHATELAQFLEVHFETDTEELPRRHQDLNNTQLRRFSTYAKRSHFNTRMGLPGKPEVLIRAITKVMLTHKIRNYWSSRFTMSDLM